MDGFGVLTERYGLKPQGKSAPMAESKRSTNHSNGQSRNFASSTGINKNPAPYSSNGSWNPESGNGSLFDGDDILFKSNSTGRDTGSYGGFDDFGVFGDLNKLSSNKSGNGKSSFNDYFMFSNFGNSETKTSSRNGYVDDDIFGGMPGVKSSVSIDNDDIFGSFPSSAKGNAPVDDLLGDVGGFGPKSTSWTQNDSGDLKKNAADFDELIPGFGGSGQRSSGASQSTAAAEDPFVVLESTSASGHCSSGLFADPLDELSNLGSSKGTKPWGSSQTSTKLKPPPKPSQKVDEVKSSGMSSIDELEDFAMGRPGRVRRSSSASDNASKYKEAEDVGTKQQQNAVDDLDTFFSAVPRSSSVPKSRATTETFSEGASSVAKKTSNKVSSSAKKAASPANLVDDFTLLFGADPLFGEFEEVQGESEDRRRARLGRHQRTQDRVAKAVADMNHRDRQTQLEQEEKRRIAETLDAHIKRWAAGKEGNMRALLSSLQNVLWPECGWEPVSITDLITSTSVKKVYRKATLCVHPDKVQQKGATLDQKYTAEKVFDILKEAWNKFNKEELS